MLLKRTCEVRGRTDTMQVMAEEITRGFWAGRTGLIVRIPEAEPSVRRWRERLDSSARAGVPAHVTVLFPFLDESRIDALVHTALADMLGSHPAFDLRFARCGRLPEVLYLVPEPDTPLRQLTEAIADRWPEAPPYGGRFAEIVPHLTIAQGQEGAVLEEIEADLAGGLPFTSHVSSVELIVHDGTKWQVRASFALGESPSPEPRPETP
ncbi:2'-5' RNA ligase family protein [Streptomyces sp. NPDC058745]|uniref:2'-5' RNA ligase family protein n=1 Tax=Streptomyces sp. NPDC058745 TaxID=3346621 RepID=UPI0036B20A15